MGIGVSYTGSNGERKSFTAGSVNALEAAMKSVAPRSPQMRGVDAMMSQQTRLLADGKESAKTKSGSAVIKDYRGEICLRGEEGDPLVEGRKLYGSVNGRKGYFSVSEIDPPINGKICGKWLNTETKPDEESANENGGAWSIPISRTAAELTGDGKLRVFNFYRELKRTADGRIVGMTAESAVLVGEFKCGGSSSGGEYEVRPFFDGNGKLVSLVFGSGSSLGNGSSPSAIQGNDANVKVVGVSEYDQILD